MTESQNRVVATVVSALILVPVFLCPWRIEATDEITWSPIYQTPITYVRTYDDGQTQDGRSRMEYEQATVAWDFLIAEILVVAVVGGVVYRFSSGERQDLRASDDPGG